MDKAQDFRQNILRTLAYYEIFDHPLTMKELYLFSPANSVSRSVFASELGNLVGGDDLVCDNGMYYRNRGTELVRLRTDRSRIARNRLRIARFFSHIIKRFPFVRGVFLSGDISKGVATPPSDIDYVVVTAPNRLWICRTLLILFKKVFLLNRKKYFCLNYFVSEDNLEVETRNYYTATEIAHLKPIVNFRLFLTFMNANSWIKEFFPNYALFDLVEETHSGQSIVIQKLLEMPFTGHWVDRLDTWLMHRMMGYWKKHYPQFNEETREAIFKCTKKESRAYAGNFSGRILNLYHDKLKEYGIA